LFALQDTGGDDFGIYVDKGLKWINGANELKKGLVDTHANIVWRCIRPPKSMSHPARIRMLAGKERIAGPPEILYECWPYELGWLLYALAPRDFGVGPGKASVSVGTH